MGPSGPVLNVAKVTVPVVMLDRDVELGFDQIFSAPTRLGLPGTKEAG
jgi:hypothetical protein